MKVENIISIEFEDGNPKNIDVYFKNIKTVAKNDKGSESGWGLLVARFISYIAWSDGVGKGAVREILRAKIGSHPDYTIVEKDGVDYIQYKDAYPPFAIGTSNNQHPLIQLSYAYDAVHDGLMSHVVLVDDNDREMVKLTHLLREISSDFFIMKSGAALIDGINTWGDLIKGPVKPTLREVTDGINRPSVEVTVGPPDNELKITFDVKE